MKINMENYAFFMLTEFWYLWVLVIICIIFRLFRPSIKGYFGEKSVSSMLSKLPKEEYIILNDIMLNTHNGTTQIDHVIVSLYGIFVIETKNYKGWIYGTENASYWTQNIYGQKKKFKNPIHQNYGHIKAIENLINNEDVKIFSIVAFSTACDLKINIPKTKVCYIKDVAAIVKMMSVNNISADTMELIKEKIASANIKDSSVRKEHVINVNNNIAKQAANISENLCPKCGEPLVLRKGK